MTSSHRQLIGVAECLPPLRLPRAEPPGTVTWCQGTKAPILVFPHCGPCARCAEYLADLSEIGAELDQWATRLLVVVGAAEPGSTAAAHKRSGYAVLVDHDNSARIRVGVSDEDVAVIVADRWGAVYQVSAAGADHFLPDPRQLVDLAKFIDIQCPECAVPSAEWRRSCPLPLG